jgi:hypothetical protein
MSSTPRPQLKLVFRPFSASLSGALRRRDLAKGEFLIRGVHRSQRGNLHERAASSSGNAATKRAKHESECARSLKERSVRVAVGVETSSVSLACQERVSELRLSKMAPPPMARPQLRAA